ncbi:MAG: lipoyl domain-containing protein [Anaerolineae bacterium]|nr:lipoyl domain-containing protein [Anaerolineae bacterium]
MNYEITVPPTADGNQEVTIRRWMVDPGNTVQQGKDLVEMTTEKIALYASSPVDGILLEIRVAVGEKARVGQVIGLVRG